MKSHTIKKIYMYIYWAICTGKFIYCIHMNRESHSPGSAGVRGGCAGAERGRAGSSLAAQVAPQAIACPSQCHLQPRA